MKRMRNLVFAALAFLTFTFSQFTAQAQQDTTLVHVNTIVEQSQLVFQNYPIEKVHLHFDKPFYAVGDTMWFKGYLTNNLLEFLPSQVLYVEVLTEKDSLMQTFRLPFENNMTKGQIVLDQKWYTKSNYRVRAYTKWMVNFDPDFFFNKVIPVGDVLNNVLHTDIQFIDNSDEKNAKLQAKIQFMERGGNVLGNKRVNYQIVNGFDVLESGKVETDAMGNITLNFQPKDKQKYATARLNVSVPDPRNPNDLLVGDFSLQPAFWDADVQFFPEGGELIAGVEKKVAFKAIGTDGLGLKVKGEIKTKAGQSVASFSDFHAGMGYFMLKPQLGEQYVAHLTFDNGKSKSFSLPEVKEQGISVIIVSENETAIKVGIASNQRYLEQFANQPFSFVAQSGGGVAFAAQINLKNELLTFDLPKDRFALGIGQLLLFSPQGVPLSERLVFVEAWKPLNIKIKSDKPSYNTKGLVKLDLSVSDNDSTYVGQYSISVVDETKVPYEENKEISILSSILLSSDLKGYIEQPNYYFNSANTNRKEAMEALMLSQGYKRFNYQAFLAGQYPEVVFLPEAGIEISGTLRLNTGRPVENGGLLLSIPDKGFKIDTYTDAQGRFKFGNLVFTDSSRVTINARGNDNYRNMVIYVDQTTFPAIDKNIYQPDGLINLDKMIRPYLENSRKVFRTDVVLEEVEVIAKPTRSHREYTSLAGLSTADHQYGPERLEGCRSLFICLQTLLTGITFDSNTQNFYITRDFNMGGRIPVQFFVNGMAVDVISLNSINPVEVEGIEIFYKDELGTVSRTYQNNGVVSIYTSKKTSAAPRMSIYEIESMLPKSNVVDLTPLGYMKLYNFYSPKYETTTSQQVADYRSTIYWNPEVTTDENGNASVSFYNADGRGTYRVIVEGMNAVGNIGRAVYKYEVK